ncbi:alpha-amylase family glycosyl hydrolase [Paenibacillus sp. PL2-23]|uniref:alpha-amylase family glycosyl hydrolase n=1 Tax=Paenibacillus sp. PL2-23 TaxID=2100729 RepID=UPI0030F832DD
MGKWMFHALLVTLLCALLTGCASNDSGSGGDAVNELEDSEGMPAIPASFQVDEQPSRVFYEIFVRAFYDTNGDGIGDLNGVTEKLDYLKELGVGGIWLMPINASPSYHGYDVTDYYAIHPEYGTLEDLKRLLDEAHKRDIQVIMDLVVNHSSSEHPWFKDALANPDSPYRSWYTIKSAQEQLQSDGAVDGNPWHSFGNLRYLGIFWGGMPDLNFEEPAVRAEMIKIGQYWLEQGLDGFRLDAAKHIFGDFKSTVSSPEVQAANKAWWQEFRKGMTEVKPDVYLIGEVWDSLAIIAPYFDNALDSAFHFDLAGKLLGAAGSESDPDLAFSLSRAYGAYERTSGGSFVDAPFLSNHDQNRVMSVLGGNADHARMAAALLLTLPGSPYLYYGEEIGMKGMKPDEFIREPMLWYSDEKGGAGQTTWISSKHNKEAGAASVEAQLGKGGSLLEHYRELISWRNEEPALRDGTIGELELEPRNMKLSAFVRVTQSERLLVVHNLSGQEQSAELTVSDAYGAFTKLARATNKDAKLEGSKLTLPPYSTAVLK